MAVPFGKFSFVAGEIAPSLFGHVDFAKFSVAASTMRNMWPSYRGGAYSRAGTAFVGFSKQTGRSLPPRLVTFQFSINQGLALEFGNFYMRVISNGAYVTESPTNISGISQANPAVVTDNGHGYANGDWVFLTGIAGMTQLNGRTLVVGNVTLNTYQLFDVYGSAIDSTSFSPYTSGGTAARIYTLVTPYAEGDLEYLKFTQSADVMSLTCWNQLSGTSYEPQDLRRNADDNWTITPPSFAASIAAPHAVSVTSQSAAASVRWWFSYVVTAVDRITANESIASNIVTAGPVDNPGIQANTLTVTWDPVDGASNYNVYRAQPSVDATGVDTQPIGALYGFVGSSVGAQFADSNIVADFSQVPPLHKNPFAIGQIAQVDVTNGGTGYTQATVGYTITTATGSGAVLTPIVIGGALASFVVEYGGEGYLPGDTISITDSGTGTGATATLSLGPQTGTYPSVVSYFQQRRVYAGTPNNPDTYFMSQPGAFTNFDSRIPTIDTDAIIGTPWSVQVNGIQSLVSMPGGLVALTGLSAWQLTGAGGSSLNPQPITPANQQAQPQAYNGCSSTVPPIKIDYDIIYVQSKGSILRDLSYNFFVNIYTGIDLTQISSHLFTGYTVREMAWCEEPYKILWAVRSDGTLLSLTYLKSQDVAGWARHDTNGLFYSVCSVTEPPVDALYTAVQRFPNGKNAFMIERMDDRIWPTTEDCWCVDSALSIVPAKPNAAITSTSASGLGALTGITGLIGGSGYSSATTAYVVDDNGEGPGAGATVAITISNGVVTSASFTAPGNNYTFPAIVFSDPAGTGSGASAKATLDNSATFVTSVPVFNSGMVGQVIRMGGGVATITAFNTSQSVVANITSPITATIPNSGGQVLPQGAGDWTLSAPVTTISGLDHLAGAVVTGLADGNVIPPTTVSAGGTVTLATPASNVTIGLGFQAQLQSVYLETGTPTIQGQRKKIADVTVRLETSRGVKVGTNQTDGSTLSPAELAPIWSSLDAVTDLAKKPYNSTYVPLYTGDSQAIPVTGGFSKPGQVCLQQDNPLPMQVLALIPDVMPGDTPQTTVSPRPARRAA